MEFITHHIKYNMVTRLRETKTKIQKEITTMMNYDELNYNPYSENYMDEISNYIITKRVV